MLAALHAGHYYSSTGPELYDVQVDSAPQITISCSPCQAIFVAGRGAWARQEHGQHLTHAAFFPDRMQSPYMRVTVRDARGRHAWPNPIWL